MPIPRDLSRREFLQAASGAAVILSAEGAAIAGSDCAAATAEAADWFDRPMRWAQLTLVEDDPGRFDPGFWLDYFRRTHSDAATLSAGGCVAYYPTRLALHHRSAWMGAMDPFGEMLNGCRRLGMVVVARTDSHAVHQDAFDAHPEWIAVDASGRRRRHWASPEMWVTCALGSYTFEFMTEVHREIMSRYRPDGIFINRWDGSGMCYCESCQKNFKDTSGLELPRSMDPARPDCRAYTLWRQQRLFDLWQTWDRAVREINPRARVIPNTGGGALSSLDMRRIGEVADTLMADRQARRGLMPPWANGKNGKEFRSTMGRKPIVGIFSVGLEEPYRWKDSVQSEAEIRIWVADGVANGLRPWFTKFGGTLNDPRWLKVVEDLYRWHHRSEKYLRNIEPMVRVGMVYSQQTAWFYGGEQAESMVEDPALGWYQALIESRIPFEMVHDQRLTSTDLDPYKVLILPNIAALSEQQCRLLTDFVERGGSLIATYQTSLYDESGQRRADFGLARLFGVSFGGRIEGPMHNAYLRLEHDSAGAHPILAGLREAPRIIHGVWRLDVQPTQSFPNPPITLIPSYPDLPMEKVYPRVAKTQIPEVYLREAGQGQGRVAYFPWDIDRTFWEVLCVDHGTILRNTLTWALNEEPRVSVQGPGVLDVTFWRQAHSLTLHLVNLTNPMMMKGPFRELIPIGPQEVRVRIPQGIKVRNARLLVADKPVRYHVSKDHLTLTVPSVLDHEVVAMDVDPHSSPSPVRR